MFHMGDMDSDCTWLPGSPAADRGGWGWGALMYGVQGRSLSCSDLKIVLTAEIRGVADAGVEALESDRM